jgi:hypothetical protein
MASSANGLFFCVFLDIDSSKRSNMETIIIHPQSKEQTKAFEQLAKAFKIPFERKKVEKSSSYDPAFVAKIKEAEEDKKAGRTIKITLDDVWK